MIVATRYENAPTVGKWPVWAIIDTVAGVVILIAIIVSGFTFVCNQTYANTEDIAR